jgi:hypothetical protein
MCERVRGFLFTYTRSPIPNPVKAANRRGKIVKKIWGDMTRWHPEDLKTIRPRWSLEKLLYIFSSEAEIFLSAEIEEGEDLESVVEQIKFMEYLHEF